MAEENTIERIKCVIIGSGPAGYTAAIYAARANLKPVLYTGLQMGGQLTTTTEVENFPGYPEGVTGPVMMEDMRKQAERFGTDIRFGIVTAVDFSGHPHKLTIDDCKQIEADAVIIATGASAKYLGLPTEEKFRGLGVSACATCDGFFYRGKAMQQRVFNTENIEVLFEHNTLELYGSDMGLEGARLLYRKGEPEECEKDIKIDGFFLAIGHHPNSEVFSKYVKVDEQGYIITEGASTRTNVPGVFAAGDIMDPVYRQGIAAAGSGCRAAIDAERYIGELESK